MEANETAIDVLSRFGFDVKYRSGVPAIDSVLVKNAATNSPGLLPGSIYEFCGASAAGKTQICFSYVAQFLRDFTDLHVAWIDLNGSFHTRRLLQFIGNEQEEFLQRVHLASAHDFSSLADLLKMIKNDLDKRKTRLLIVDNVGSMLFETNWIGQKGNDQKSFLIRKMLDLCKNGVTVITTNHTVESDHDMVRSSLGPVWFNSIKHRYYVIRDKTSRIIKNNTKKTRFIITNTCIESYPDSCNEELESSPPAKKRRAS